jgi:steroid 5-alpha reductase family enzyme
VKEPLKNYLSVVVILVFASCIAIAGGQGGATFKSVPLLVICMGGSFFIHWFMFIPSFIAKSEKFYDITGTLAYLSLLTIASALTVSLSGIPLSDRSLLLLVLVSIWSLRLGSFLFCRIIQAGEDRRFRKIKVSFSKFFLTWSLSGLWVFITSANALTAIINNVPLKNDPVSYFGIFLWYFGFFFESIADEQKRRFRNKPENVDEFITHGLWRYSRHPNYFGEIVLWTGIALISMPTLSGWQYSTLISPLFVFLLLTRISGINLLEARADKLWGHRQEYKHYKQTTPALLPFINR